MVWGKSLRKSLRSRHSTSAGTAAKGVAIASSLTATTEAIDRAARTVTVRGAERTLTIKGADDTDRAGIESGDEVRAIYSESVAIPVTSATPADTTPE